MESTSCQAPRLAAAARTRSGYTQVPDQVDAIDSKACRDFFRKLKSLHRFQPYVDETIEEIAHRVGVSVSTAQRHINTILGTRVPGFTHSFATRIKVRGRWRYYLVDQYGMSTVPVDDPDVKNERPMRRKCGPGVTPATIGARARRFRSEDRSNESLRIQERKRQAIPDAPIGGKRDSMPMHPEPEQPADSGTVPAPISQAPDAISADHPAAAQEPYVVARILEEQPVGGLVAIATREIVEPAVASMATSDPRTDGQLAFLAVLTPQQRSTFDGFDPRRQARILEPHALELNLIIAEFQKRHELIPPKPAPQVPDPGAMPTAELIGRLPQCTAPTGAFEAARRIMAEFSPGQISKYRAGLQMLMFAVWRGKVDAKSVRFVYEYVTDPSHNIDNREAYFWRAVREKTGIKGDDLSRLAYGEDFPKPGRPCRRA